MKLLFVTPGLTSPSARFRVHPFLAPLRKTGVAVRVCEPAESMYRRYEGSFSRLRHHAFNLSLLAQRIRPFCRMDAFDLVFLQREALPFPVRLPEMLAQISGARVLYDVDDAVFCTIQGTPDPRKSAYFTWITRWADLTIAGNSFLASHCSRPDRTCIIPTSIDTHRYVPMASQRSSRPIVVWTGSDSNLPFLSSAVPWITEVLRRHDALLRVICDQRPRFSDPNLPWEFVPWSAQTEVQALQPCAVGIMPLPNTPWTQGKCGFKILQYMAVGLPVVASPVGVNREMVRHGETGFLANSPDEWADFLARLLSDASLGTRIGAHARDDAVARWSLDRWLPVWLESVLRTARP